jgi:MSHA biogenesis protein MshK
MTISRLLLFIVLAAVCAVASADNIRDPTRPPSPAEIRAFFGAEPAAGHPSYQLQSILLSDERRVAIINGRRVSEGHVINQAEVVTIEPGRVVLRRDGKSIVLTIASRRAPDGLER